VTQAATVYSSILTTTHVLDDSIGLNVTGALDQPTAASYLYEETFADGGASVTIDAGVSDFAGSSSLQMVHQNTAQVPSFPALANSVNSVLLQTVRFVADAGDGNFSIAGSATGIPTPGLSATTTITVILRDLTTLTDLINVSVTNDVLVANSGPPIALVEGHHYELILRTENQMQSSATEFGGSVSTGGVLNLNIGGTWSYDEAIPEPSSALLAAMGMCLGVVRRRRS
jgi:hypothetical protein